MNIENDFRFDFGSDESRWQQLLNEIDNGNVVPVIGPDLLVDAKIVKENNGIGESVRMENFHQQLISFIAAKTGVDTCPRTFSQLVYAENYKIVVRTSIYDLINQAINGIHKITEIDAKPSQLLIDLLGTKKFPFVITTSFAPIVENAMKNIWGHVNVLKFNANPPDSLEVGFGDINSVADLKSPTVYYMFGRCGNLQDQYAVTDSDMMRFCGKWIKGDGVPKKLMEVLKQKYLLILGNNFSDWLFRFIWYGLRSTTNVMKSDIVVNDRAEDSFKEFLERLETFFQEDPAKAINNIKENMEKRRMAKSLLDSYDTDVFISYSRTDEAIAEELKKALESNDLKVWFDKTSIGPEKWKDAINKGIKSSRLFVPILTHNVEKEFVDPHEYREEWNIAAAISCRMGGRTFIIPIAEKDFDFYSKTTQLPKEFLDINAFWFADKDEIKKIADKIVSETNKLKELKKILG